MKRMLFLLALSLPLFILWKCLDQYVLSPRYSFADPRPFGGQVIINPYDDVNLDRVAIANFHAHTKIWNGLTNGKGQPQDLYRRYDSLGHDFHAVSQYHHIDTFGQHAGNYVPAYEHGYNLKKTHQLVIGGSQVLWKDYLFPQSIHNKQDILYRLAEDTGNIVVINHPAIRNGYTMSDLKKLHYYDYIELLNPSAQSLQHWDTILSAGKKVFAMGNDDIHNIFNDKAIGRFVTMIYGTNADVSGLYPMLRKGAAAAVWLPQEEKERLFQKRIRIENIKKVVSRILVKNDSVQIILNHPVAKISLITSNGVLKASDTLTSKLSVPLFPDETYWRFEILLQDKTRIFLNPLYRQTDYQQLARNEAGRMNVSANKGNPTMALFLGVFIMVLGSSGLKFNKRRRRHKNDTWMGYPTLSS